ncbi:MAG: hypothetical protein EWV83_01860 [Microcystis sp. M_OC_Ca_00000000_S217Cul]|nr:MAG: hypothetical protein EWV83_01860 [Microcystis sp. M_OC_Ca_00000000_S217Cul]TRT92478.1 MAG: hypothetical protein EWV66_04300 [Microcystis sp. M_OC_Ca_00000000_C217Col]
MLYDKNIITKLVGFCYLDLNDKISDLLRSAFGIALLIRKKRSHLAFLSQAMTILKFNQQDDSDRTTRSASVIDVR